MSNAAHTPTPYHVGKESDDGVYGILVSSGQAIGYAKTEEDAAFIVRAVNAHDGLILALQTIALHAPSLDATGIRELADAALKAAGVE